MMLYITREDIAAAHGRSSIWNPIYLAIARQTGQSWCPGDRWLWSGDGLRLEMPPDLAAWWHGWQHETAMRPIEVEVDILGVEEAAPRQRRKKGGGA